MSILNSRVESIKKHKSEGTEPTRKDLFDYLYEPLEKGELTMDQVLDDFLLLIFAGHETTMHAL